MSVFESLLNHDFTISRQVRTFDGQGGWTISYAETGTVRGRLRPASSSEREAAQADERVVTHVFYCNADEDILRGDRITLGDLVVDVEGRREPSKAGKHLELDCRERQFEISEEGGS